MKALLVIINCCFVFKLYGQDLSKPDPRTQVINVDVVNNTIKEFTLLPFDAPVEFVGDFEKNNPNGYTHFFLYYRYGRCVLNKASKDKIRKNQKSVCDTVFTLGGCDTSFHKNIFGSPNQFVIYFGKVVNRDLENEHFKPYYFKPDQRYCLHIIQKKDSLLANDSTFTMGLKFDAHTASSLSDKLKVDIGVAYALNAKSIFGIVSLHYYFLPINESADIKIMSKGAHWFCKRFSVFACIAPVVIASGSSQEITSLPNLGNFGFGVGWRSPFYGYSSYRNPDRVYQRGRKFQPFRLNVGFIHFAQRNPDPHVTTPLSRWSPMISLTYSFSVTGLLAPFGKIFE